MTDHSELFIKRQGSGGKHSLQPSPLGERRPWEPSLVALLLCPCPQGLSPELQRSLIIESPTYGAVTVCSASVPDTLRTVL